MFYKIVNDRIWIRTTIWLAHFFKKNGPSLASFSFIFSPAQKTCIIWGTLLVCPDEFLTSQFSGKHLLVQNDDKICNVKPMIWNLRFRETNVASIWPYLVRQRLVHGAIEIGILRTVGSSVSNNALKTSSSLQSQFSVDKDWSKEMAKNFQKKFQKIVFILQLIFLAVSTGDVRAIHTDSSTVIDTAGGPPATASPSASPLPLLPSAQNSQLPIFPGLFSARDQCYKNFFAIRPQWLAKL